MINFAFRLLKKLILKFNRVLFVYVLTTLYQPMKRQILYMPSPKYNETKNSQ